MDATLDANHAIQNKEITVGEWMLTLFLMIIPLVNIIMLFIWAFGGGQPVSKANWAKASLIWVAIGFVFYIIVFAMMGAAMMNSM